ncbi:DUF4097 domain-containing protein [Paenibacillus sp. sptzw28]|uniref:DUF4097 family beta strand repeat-containing protein n=1 Tax=Paenibacillus sp. sptzw28 TaxID=715179 RepID=UPI001C6E361A|nr:DUF4097 family beta strand repeat-containing protein [Paenibacillus sp. sptzw28]QYR20720.1 DUF4097 domain-containing protein [Paenibacillus sp. sptzw28]
MRTPKIDYRKIAPFLAFLIPGAGHLALGLHLRGLMLITGVLTDIVAMVRFADEGGGRFALLIVFLGLALPLFWFFSVFDTLQQEARLRESADGQLDQEQQGAAWLEGAAVVAVGLVLLGLVRSPSVLIPWLDAVGTFAPGAGLTVIAAMLVVKRGRTMFRIGRFTAATVVIATGALLLWDEIQGRNDIRLLGQWWPAAFVLLGIEIVVYSLTYRSAGRKLSFDIGGSFLSVIIAVTAYTVTQYTSMPFSWLDNFKVDLAGMSGYSDEKGFKYEKETISVPITPETSALAIDNPNGKVTVKKGNVSEMTVQTVMWVDVADKQEADQVAEQSKIDITGDNKLKIAAKGEPYGTNGSRKPRMNIIITIPEASRIGQLPAMETGGSFNEKTETSGAPGSSYSLESSESSSNGAVNSQTINGESFSENSAPAADSNLSKDGTEPAQGAAPPDGEAADKPSPENQVIQTELSIQVSNGSVDVSGLVLPGGLKVKVTNGEIALRKLEGPVTAESKNGSILATDIKGNVQLATYNGGVKALRILGDIEGSTLSGNIELEHISGNSDVETKNGEIIIREAEASIKADTLNGDIAIHSATVGGDWDIDSSIGDINLFVPENGDYSVNGSVTFGNVYTDLPLTASKNTIRGDIGTATYRINIDANSSITVNHYTP